MITASVFIDLVATREDRRRQRLAVLADAPDGARAALHVGYLMPSPSLTWVIAEHEPRLIIDVQGDPRAVRDWLAAIAEHSSEVRR